MTANNLSRTVHVQPDAAALAAFYHTATSLRLPVALWRHPAQRTAHGVLALSGRARSVDIDFRVEQPGFLIAPFVDSHGADGSRGNMADDNASRGDVCPLFIAADVYLGASGLQTFTTDGWQSLIRGAAQPLTAAQQTFWHKYQTQLQKPTQTPGWYTPAAAEQERISDRAAFCSLVHTAIDFIAQSELDKIVVSRLVETPLPPSFDPVETFARLCERYAHAFVSLVAIPEVGVWIGASPELLLAVEENGLRTMALAGTQAHPHNTTLDAVRWGAKDVEEQALVSDYIRRFFAQAGATNVQEVGPHTVAAGNVVHLQTTFRVPFGAGPHEQTQLAELANGVLHRLHPTSAVCGMPKEKALSFILAHEGYNRRFYSGFLGPVHIEKSSHLFVNLRCMELGADTARLYVGCGITADSAPDAEWQESVLKAQTLLSVLHGKSSRMDAVCDNGIVNRFAQDRAHPRTHTPVLDAASNGTFYEG